MHLNPLLWHTTQVRIKTHTNYPHYLPVVNILSQQHLMKCPTCLWQWPKLSGVVCLSPRLSVCLNMHWIPGAVQVSSQRRTTEYYDYQRIPPRLQTPSVAFLAKQSKNMVSPFVLATLSRRAHQCPYWETGALDTLVQFPDNVDYRSESDGVSFGCFHSRSREISCIYNSMMPFPPVHQHTGLIQQPWNLI